MHTRIEFIERQAVRPEELAKCYIGGKTFDMLPPAYLYMEDDEVAEIRHILEEFRDMAALRRLPSLIRVDFMALEQRRLKLFEINSENPAGFGFLKAILKGFGEDDEVVRIDKKLRSMFRDRTPVFVRYQDAPAGDYEFPVFREALPEAIGVVAGKDRLPKGKSLRYWRQCSSNECREAGFGLPDDSINYFDSGAMGKKEMLASLESPFSIESYVKVLAEDEVPYPVDNGWGAKESVGLGGDDHHVCIDEIDVESTAETAAGPKRRCMISGSMFR